MALTLTVTNERAARIPQPRVVSEDPLVVEIKFPEIQGSVSMTVERTGQEDQAVIRFDGSLVGVLSRFMNGKIDYEYGAGIIESIRRLSTLITDRQRRNYQGTLLFI